MSLWPHQALTSDIIAVYYAIFHAVQQRSAYRTADFSTALQSELRLRGHTVQVERSGQSKYRDQSRGRRSIALIVDDKVALVIEKVPLLKDEHAAQLQAKLADGGWAIGLLLNFGSGRPELRRIENRERPEG